VQRLPKLWLTLTLLAGVAGLLPCSSVAQDDPNEAPLGDVARSLRKKTPSSQDVIDNDNLPQVMDQVESKRGPGSALKLLMTGDSKGFQVSAPDVTCNLSFTANTKSLLSSQYAQMDLPQRDMVKLEGPATIEGDALTVSVFNSTGWHVSEVDVALMIIRKNAPAGWPLALGSESPAPPVTGLGQESEVRPEKKPDVTVIYRMRAAAPPFATTVFSAPLDLDLAPGDEWHWAIVQAKGYPPQTYALPHEQTAAQTSDPAPAPPVVPPALLLPPDSPAASMSQNPQ